MHAPPAPRSPRSLRIAPALVLAAALGATALWTWPREAPPAGPRPTPTAPPEASARPAVDATPPEEGPFAADRVLAMPDGDPPALDCDAGRRIMAQARSNLATPTEPIDGAKYAAAVSDWLDPHGFWSVAPDSPVGALLVRRAGDMLQELEAPAGSGPCTVTLEIGAELEAWVEGLRASVVDARSLARKSAVEARRRFEVASTTPFEDGLVTRRGRDLARIVGHRIGVVEAAYERVGPFASAAVERLVPGKSPEEWSRVVVAAAVRAYLPQIDPHGAWAPLDEEASIYDVDLEVDPPPRIWGDMTRTALGVRIDRDARAPLKDGDVVLRVGDRMLGGMSVEQANQLSFVPFAQATRVTVVRNGEPGLLELEVETGPTLLSLPPAGATLTGLSSARVTYGAGHALVIRVPDVPDDLGDRIVATIEAGRGETDPVGILLDLRGNGGGSTDGALSAVGVFLPGAALFPMRRRDGDVEVDRAPRLPPDSVWTGPVAALVDGESASAAEMIAGALAAYRRGTVVGSRTYGKGCAQEYLDDEAGVGVLRLTTLVFCLPDGSPLQRVGVSPHIALGLPASDDREAALPRAPLTWSGPDVRDEQMVRSVPWPDHGGRVGTASDPSVYRALRALGSARAASRK